MKFIVRTNIRRRAKSKPIEQATSKPIEQATYPPTKQQSSISKMSANAANAAYAVHFKEIIAKMPDTFTMKEVDEYCKKAKKDIKATFNEEKKEKKDKKAQPKKRANKKAKVDDDGNDIVKVKKPLSKYLQFLQDNRPKVIEENPGLKSKEYMSLLATLWNKHKEDNNDN